MKRKKTVILLVAVSWVFCSCQATYYKARESFGGQRKRDILVDRVREVRNAQAEAIQQFQYAFDQFGSVLNYRGNELGTKYKKLKAEFKKSRSRGRVVTRKIESVKDVAEPLFAEWQNELEKFENEQLRTASSELYRHTRNRYDELMTGMERARDQVDVMLKAFDDQALFLKHNLNAQAIDSLDDEYNFLEKEFTNLKQKMRTSIDQSNAFIQMMKTGSADDTIPSETEN